MTIMQYVIAENTTVVYSSCLSDGSWSLVSLTCMYDKEAMGNIAGAGASFNWEDSSQMNISTIIIIGVLSALIVLSLIIVIIITSHRRATSEENTRKISRSSTNQLLYDQVAPKTEDDYSVRSPGLIFLTIFVTYRKDKCTLVRSHHD